MKKRYEFHGEMRGDWESSKSVANFWQVSLYCETAGLEVGGSSGPE